MTILMLAGMRPLPHAVSRVGSLLAEGEVAYQVLVLRPQASAWPRFDSAGKPLQLW